MPLPHYFPFVITIVNGRHVRLCSHMRILLLVLIVINNVNHSKCVSLLNYDVVGFLTGNGETNQSFVKEIYVVDQVTFLIDVLIDTCAHVPHPTTHPCIK